MTTENTNTPLKADCPSAPCSAGLRKAAEIVADIADKEVRNAPPNQKDIIRWVTNRIEKEIRNEISKQNA